MSTYFNDGADPSGYKDKQTGLLIKQVEENHYGAETSPQHWRKEHKHKILYHDVFADDKSMSTI